MILISYYYNTYLKYNLSINYIIYYFASEVRCFFFYLKYNNTHDSKQYN